METFKAGVQYGDMKGTVAADRHDTTDMKVYLETNNLIQPGEFIAGIYVTTGEVHAPLGDRPIGVVVYLFKGAGADSFSEVMKSSAPLKLRSLDLEMQPSDFFSLFKRFNMTLSYKGMLEGKEILSE